MGTDYKMTISTLVVDKLGVKLYDKVSAVLAELIANSYDADATQVTVRAPMGRFLATRNQGVLLDKEYEIEVIDNGTGMTPVEMQNCFLPVGAERRQDAKRGDTSPKYKRKVMGRKGIGKLAPFGICKVIEVESAGGDRIKCTHHGKVISGHRASHIILNYDDIVSVGQQVDGTYFPERGDRDDTLQDTRGTRITLRLFDYRKVPDIRVLDRQTSRRFGIQSSDWQITLTDTGTEPPDEVVVGRFHVPVMPNTKLTFEEDGSVVGPEGDMPDLRAGFDLEERHYPIRGWMAYSRTPHKDDLMAGVRIYCRGKIAAQTLVFNRPAGFTGEYSVRSYLVGQLSADWLDEEEDLIQTDRRDILWSDRVGMAFQEWGQDIVSKIGQLSRDPTRKATLGVFLATGRVQERIKECFSRADHDKIRDNALKIAKTFGKTISHPEAEDEEVVGGLVDLSIALAPHITMNEMMREATENADAPLEVLSGFLRTARIAELSSFGQIAENRIKVIRQLEAVKTDYDTKEPELQRLLKEAPWLIDPEWAPITANRTLRKLRFEFEKYHKMITGTAISLADFQDSDRRPDFVLIAQDETIQIVEIKRPGHSLTNKEMDRIIAYHDSMTNFLGQSEERFRYRSVHITLVCDEVKLTGAQRTSLQKYKDDGKLTRLSWPAFLDKTEHVHRDFLVESERQKQLAVTSDGET